MKQKLLSFLVLCSLLIGVAHAQNRTITGRVTSADDGSSLAGVSVTVRGTSQSTQSREDGTYTITASQGAILVFRSVGYVERTVAVGSSNTINVALQLQDELIEDVVVVGYGSAVPLSTVVGSVAQVRAESIKDRPTANALEALQGRVAGLQVFTSNGEPSVTQSTRLRGIGSLGSSSTPLYVIDGVPVNAGSMVSLNPDDFESMTVLKDASATSIYGSRAANGVIYITTKKGRRGETSTINIRSQVGWSNLANTKPQESFMNADEILNFWLETGYRTQAQVDQLRQDFPNDTKWWEYYYNQDVPMQQHDINVSGGGDRTTYYISGSYFNQEGLMYRSGFERYTLRSNLDTRVNSWMRMGLNLSGGYDTRETNGWGLNDTNGGLSMLAPPFYTPYDEDGNEYYGELIPGWNRHSPRYLADMHPNHGNNAQFNPTAYIEIKPLEGLTFRSQAGMDYYSYRSTSRRMPSFVNSPNNGTASETFTSNAYKTWNNTLEYKWDIQDRHKFTALLGQEFVDNDYQTFNASGQGLTDDRLILLSSAPNNRDISQSITEFAFSSLFGRISYNLDGKYSIDATLRQDRSSRFGKDREAALFWSLGGFWNAKEESFLADTDWLNELRFRSSIGTSGNSEIGNYQHLATVGTAFYDGGTSWGLSAPGNPNLGWERQTMFNVGVNTTVLDRLSINLEYYKRITKEMLVSVPYPYTTGFANVTANVGSLQNTGVDLNVSFEVFKNRDYYLSPYITYGYVKDKVTELFQGNDYWIVPNTGVTWAVGQPISFFYPIKAGVNPENGLLQWYVPGDDISQTRTDASDVTSNFNAGALQQNTGIRRYPPHTGGFGFDAGWKGFSIQTHFAFSKGKYLINNDRYFFENPYNFAGFNQSRRVMDYWKQPGDVTEFPAYGQILQFDSGLIEDASFLRMKTLQVGYSLPKSITQRTNLFKNARIFYMGRNLLTFTSYLGPDPEVDSNLTYGVNPNTKQHTIGLEIQF